MPRRGYDRIRRCGAEGCREVLSINYEFKRDYIEAVRDEKGRPWLCARHDKPEQVLSIDNPEVTYDSGPSNEVFRDYGSGPRSIGVFWDRCGFRFGDGYRAWAEDFPVGTRLIVTARILLPPLSEDKDMALEEADEHGR